jgi:hypothetical protein
MKKLFVITLLTLRIVCQHFTHGEEGFYRKVYIEACSTYASESACLYIVCSFHSSRENIRLIIQNVIMGYFCLFLKARKCTHNLQGDQRALSQAEKREIFKCFKLILGALKISAKSYTTSNFMPRFCGYLGIAVQ